MWHTGLVVPNQSPWPWAMAVGFKLFPEHVTRGGGGGGGGGQGRLPPTLDFYERLLADPRIKKIILRRENRVATCASVLRSSVTGSFLGKNLDHVKVRRGCCAWCRYKKEI